MSTSLDRIASGATCGWRLSAEEPDALMRARPGLWEPWRVTARATRPGALLIGYFFSSSSVNPCSSPH
jgi:hypothetical protein